MLKNRYVLKLNRKQSEWLFYVSLLMLSIMVFLLVGEPGYVLYDDSKTYMNINNNMEGVMPIYPSFLYGNKLLFGEDVYLYAVVVEQAVLAAVCINIFIRFVKERFELKYWEAYICYALALLPFTTDMPEVMTTHEILTEGVAYAVFYLFMAALLHAVWDKSWKWLGISCMVTLVLSLTRSQMQILFGVCGAVSVYIIMCRCGRGRRGLVVFSRLLCGVLVCAVIGLAGVWSVGKVSTAYQNSKAQKRREQQQLEQQTQVQEESGETSKSAAKPVFTTSQYVSLIFSRGMYEADYEDYLLFEEGQLRDLYLVLYERSEKTQCRYVYAEPGLWMWRDIVGGIGSVGSKCFHIQNNFYNENYPELVYSSNYSAVRNSNQLKIGLTLLKEHFGRFLYHTLMLLPQAFICTVFFQIERIYLLCHIVTLMLYLTAAALMIWAYKDKKVGKEYGEFMCSVLGTNLILIGVISLVFFGQQRYLVYNFGIFYISYFLLLLRLWKLYGCNLAAGLWKRFRKCGNGEYHEGRNRSKDTDHHSGVQ